MSAPRDELIEDHEYDGIREYDNPLPKWWLALLYGSIVFAVAYVPYYHFGPGQLPHEEYAAAMAAAAELTPKLAMPSPDELRDIANSEKKIAEGKAVYTQHCVACHGPDGGGLVGPNLTDKYWVNGKGEMPDLVEVIYNGVPEKGMIAWKTQLDQDEIYATAAYVKTLQGTTPTNPREPQGALVE